MSIFNDYLITKKIFSFILIGDCEKHLILCKNVCQVLLEYRHEFSHLIQQKIQTKTNKKEKQIYFGSETIFFYQNPKNHFVIFSFKNKETYIIGLKSIQEDFDKNLTLFLQVSNNQGMKEQIESFYKNLMNLYILFKQNKLNESTDQMEEIKKFIYGEKNNIFKFIENFKIDFDWLKIILEKDKNDILLKFAKEIHRINIILRYINGIYINGIYIFGGKYTKMFPNIILPEKETDELGKEYLAKIIYLLPLTVKKIVFPTNFNSSLGNVLVNFPCLEVIQFGDRFNMTVSKSNLPESIKKIIFGNDYNKKLDDLSESIQEIYLGKCFNQPIKTLPNSIEFISFGDFFNQSIKNIPISSIETIIIPKKYLYIEINKKEVLSFWRRGVKIIEIGNEKIDQDLREYNEELKIFQDHILAQNKFHESKTKEVDSPVFLVLYETLKENEMSQIKTEENTEIYSKKYVLPLSDITEKCKIEETKIFQEIEEDDSEFIFEEDYFPNSSDDE